MTGRARWLLFISLAGLLAGINRGQPTVVLLSVAAFIWIVMEWLWFQFRLRTQIPRISIRRLINGRDVAQDTLWSGRRIAIELVLESDRTLSPNIEIVDVVPEIFEFLRSSGRTVSNHPPRQVAEPSSTGSQLDHARHKGAPLSGSFSTFIKMAKWIGGRSQKPGEYPNEFRLAEPTKKFIGFYDAVARSAGQTTLPGMRLTFGDRFGFFSSQRFIKVEQRFSILPSFHQSGELKPGVKRYNSLPRHGIHRLQRAGAGSELLELREYSPGDPPKSIAWKVSARREQLMTRQYESEVPVRVRFFVDGSPTVRMGGFGRRMLDQANYVAASIAKAATTVGDPISGMLVDRDEINNLPWYSGDRGFLQFLKELSDFSLRPPPESSLISPSMLRSALSVMQARFPELLDQRYYRQPFSFSSSKLQRYRAATLVAEIFDLTAWEQTRCYLDDRLLCSYLQKLLFHFGMPWMAPLTPPLQHDVETDPRSVAELAKAMSRAVAHARDNEVLVVLSSVTACAANVKQLTRVAKLALAKHHRVAFVFATTTFKRPESQPVSLESAEIADLLWSAERGHIRELSNQLKRELTRIGAAVSFSGEQSAMRMVLGEIDRARDGRTQQAGVRR